MMRSLLAALVLFLPWSVRAFDPVTIAVIPDTQFLVYCSTPSATWTMGFAAFTWLEAQSSYVDYAVQVGDIVEKKALSYAVNDCGCMSQVDADSDGCADITHPEDSSITCTSCDDADAIACAADMGSTGNLCEWERAAAMRDEASSISIMWCNGNHDYDRSVFYGITVNDWTLYKSYLTDKPMPAGVDAGGSKEFFNTTDNATGPVQWHLFTASNTQWLSISIPLAPWHRPTTPGAKENRAAIVEYVLEIIDRFPGVPTIIASHLMVSSDNVVGTHPSDRDCGFCEDQAGDDWVGKTMFNQVASVRPQVFMMIGGHDRALRQIVTTTDNGDRVLGVLADYSYGFDDSIAGVADNSYLDADVGSTHGGGGAIVMLSIDPVAGRIWAWSKIAHDDAGDGTTATDGRDVRPGDYAAYWTVQMPFCQDPDRFNLPAAACPDTTPAVVAR